MVSDRCDIRILFFMPIIKFPTLACLPSSHIIIKQHTIKYYMSAFENSTHKCDLFFCEIGCQSQLWLEILKKWNFLLKNDTVLSESRTSALQIANPTSIYGRYCLNSFSHISLQINTSIFQCIYSMKYIHSSNSFMNSWIYYTVKWHRQCKQL